LRQSAALTGERISQERCWAHSRPSAVLTENRWAHTPGCLERAQRCALSIVLNRPSAHPKDAVDSVRWAQHCSIEATDGLEWAKRGSSGTLPTTLNGPGITYQTCRRSSGMGPELAREMVPKYSNGPSIGLGGTPGCLEWAQRCASSIVLNGPSAHPKDALPKYSNGPSIGHSRMPRTSPALILSGAIDSLERVHAANSLRWAQH
jgi:hypothetical protein